MITSKDILKYSLTDTLEDSKLSSNLMSYYSKMYRNGQAVHGCRSSRENFYKKIQLDDKMGKLTIREQASKASLVVRSGFRLYSSVMMEDIDSTMLTDEKAIKCLIKKALPSKLFKVLPIGYPEAIEALKNGKPDQILNKAIELNRAYHLKQEETDQA